MRNFLFMLASIMLAGTAFGQDQALARLPVQSPLVIPANFVAPSKAYAFWYSPKENKDRIDTLMQNNQKTMLVTLCNGVEYNLITPLGSAKPESDAVHIGDFVITDSKLKLEDAVFDIATKHLVRREPK